MVSDSHLVVQWVDGDVQRRVVPFHLLSLIHVHFHRAPLRRADASHAKYDEEHEESNADDGNHGDSGACHSHPRFTLIDSVKVLRPTQHKIDHFRNVLPSQALC